MRNPGIDCGHAVTFRHFRSYRYENVSPIDVNLYARKVWFSLLHVDNYCGHMVKVRRFLAYIFDNMSWTYVYGESLYCLSIDAELPG